tara:strand:- start:7737 stop:8405 length:669 start_codon:yes stop_codon:yes gene_type:complete
MFDIDVIPLAKLTSNCDERLFDSIAQSIREKGYSIHPNALAPDLAQSLWRHVTTMEPHQFKRAGIGRENDRQLNTFVRTDEVCWINGESDAGRDWLAWTSALQQHLNRSLLLGLFSFESHFAHYAKGDFYKKHLDAFKGEANRVLSVVVYLNPNWQAQDGGELVIYLDDNEQVRVVPGFGTVVVFLSEDFPHEVLPASRDRYSIAGWFRVNTSTADRIDPPK